MSISLVTKIRFATDPADNSEAQIVLKKHNSLLLVINTGHTGEEVLLHPRAETPETVLLFLFGRTTKRRLW